MQIQLIALREYVIRHCGAESNREGIEKKEIAMLRCASVYTYEIDDPEIALEDIKTQLGKKIELLGQTVGIIMCHPEFIASGVVRYLSENLPFILAGATSSAQAVNDEAGELILTIFVMTSDDSWFKTGVTGDLVSGLDSPIKSALNATIAGEQALPKLAIVFPPLILEYAGDAYVSAWENVLPGVPIFGAIAIEDTMPFDDCETINGGETYKTALTYVLCFDNPCCN